MAEKIVVASGKGGVGKSSCCIGIGKMLGRMGFKVLIIDGDVGLRSLDILLSVSDRTLYDWGDVIFSRCRKEDAVIKSDSVDLLSCPLSFEKEFTPEKIKEMTALYDGDYDYIIIDAPAGLDTGFELACVSADRAIIVSTPDRVCVRSASRAADRVEKLGIHDVRLIINRFRKKSVMSRKLLNIDSVIDETYVQLIGVVPEDDNITYGKIATGRTGASDEAFMRIAGRIRKEEIPLVIK